MIRTDVSVGIDTNKIGGSRECKICQYWHLLYINFRFQIKVCGICHDLTQKSVSFHDVVIVTIIAAFHKQRPGNYSICLSGQTL